VATSAACQTSLQFSKFVSTLRFEIIEGQLLVEPRDQGLLAKEATWQVFLQVFSK
jgi:hypothetical protein